MKAVTWQGKRNVTVENVPDPVIQEPTDTAIDAVGLNSLYHCFDVVRRGGTVSIVGVYAGMVDPIPMDTLFDKQLTIRMGQANVKRWVDDIMPLLTDADPLGVDSFATHHLSLDEAPAAYETFQKKQDGAIKIVLHP